MTRLVAIAAALAAACAATHWIVERRCTPPYDLPGVTYQRCSDLTIPYALCIIEYTDGPDLLCESQLERRECDGGWDEVAHRCTLRTEPPPGAETMLEDQ